MNWNGGTLPRASKNAKTSLSVVQRRHFAKVRGKLLNGSPSSPEFDFSVFEDAKHRETLPQRPELEESRILRDHQTQRKSGKIDSIAPIVRHRNSIKPHDGSLHRNRSPTVVTKRWIDRRHQSGTLKQPFAIPSSSRPSSASTLKSAAQVIQQQMDQTSHQAGTDVLEGKRQELLCMRDWAGLERTKPVHMRFAEVEDRDLIGKRRRLDIKRYEGQDNELHKGRRTDYSHEKLDAPVQAAGRPTSLENISIRIGSARSQSREAEYGRSMVSGPHYGSVTSEEMLFAEEFPATMGNYSPPRLQMHPQGFESPPLAPYKHDAFQSSPFLSRTTPGSLCQYIAGTINSAQEEHTVTNNSHVRSSTRNEGGMCQVPNNLPLHFGNLLDSDGSSRLDDLHQTAPRDRWASEVATPKALHSPVGVSTYKAGQRAIIASAKHDDGPKRYDFYSSRPITQGESQGWPFQANTTRQSPARRETFLAIKNRTESHGTKETLDLPLSEMGPVECTTVTESLNCAAAEVEQDTNLKNKAESENVAYKLPQKSPTEPLPELIKESTQEPMQNPTIEPIQDPLRYLLREHLQGQPKEPLVDEEKLWRDFVFGSDDGDRGATVQVLEDPATIPPIYDYESSIIGQFDSQEALPSGSENNAGSSIFVEASLYSESNLPASSNIPSVLAQASDSPPRIQHLRSDCSSDDPLAWTPARLMTPKIVFKRPPRYEGDQEGARVPIRIGHRSRDKFDARGNVDEGKGQKTQMVNVLEDEIEDD